MENRGTSAGSGRVNIIDPCWAATAELLTLFLLRQGVAIGLDAARCLLAGIITDTRAFEFDATTARTLLAGAHLRGCGAGPEAIIKPMYRPKPLPQPPPSAPPLPPPLGNPPQGRLHRARYPPSHFPTT